MKRFYSSLLRSLVVLVSLLIVHGCSEDPPEQDPTTDAGDADAGMVDTDTGECTDGEQQPCGNDEGTCSAGTQTCMNGQWGACEGSTGPSAESCTGLDDNCDGFVDNIDPMGFDGFWLDDAYATSEPPALAADGDSVWVAWAFKASFGEPGDIKIARVNADGSYALEPSVLSVPVDTLQSVEGLQPVDGGLMIAYRVGGDLHTAVVSNDASLVDGPHAFGDGFAFDPGRYELIPAAGGVLMTRIGDGRLYGTRLGPDGAPLDAVQHRLDVGEGADVHIAALTDRYGVLSSGGAEEAAQLHIRDHYGRELVDPVSVGDPQERNAALGLFGVDDGFLAVWGTFSQLYMREFGSNGTPRTEVTELPLETNGADSLLVVWNGRGITAFTHGMKRAHAWTRDGEVGIPEGAAGTNRRDLPQSSALEECEECDFDGVSVARSNAGWIWATSIGLPNGDNRGRLRGGPIACPVREDSCGDSATSCDGWDRDCDGRIEERPAPDGSCNTGLPGVCSEGSYACAQNGPTCAPQTFGEAPACDGLDNTCNGLVDDMPLVDELTIPLDGVASSRTYITAVDGGWQIFWNERPFGTSGGSLMTVKIDSNFAMQGTPANLGPYASEFPDTATDGQRTWVAWDDDSTVRLQLLVDGQPRAEAPVEVGRGTFPRVFHRNGEVTVTWDQSNTEFYAAMRVYDDALSSPSAPVRVGDVDASARGLTLAPYADKWLAVWSERANPDDGSETGDKRYLVKAGVVTTDGTPEGSPTTIGANRTTSTTDASIVHAAHPNIAQRDDGGYWVVWGSQSQSAPPVVASLDASLQLEGDAPLLEFRHGGLSNYSERYDVEMVDGRLRTLNYSFFVHDVDGEPQRWPLEGLEFGTLRVSDPARMAPGPDGLIFIRSGQVNADPEQWEIRVSSMIECSLQ